MGNDVASADTLTAPADAGEPADVDAIDEVTPGLDGCSSEVPAEPPGGRRITWHPMAFGLAVVTVLAALVGWLGFQSFQVRQAQVENGQFLQAARQGALNLTTIDWRRADDDVKRIVDGATGEFYDDFQQRAAPFVEVVKQAQSISTGTVTEAALESHSSTEAQALVAVSVQTSNTTGAEPIPRAWRMRISVQKLDGQLKISRVEFVP